MATKHPAPATKNSRAAREQAEQAAVYSVLSPLDHDGVRYAIGETVELSEAQAAPLLDHTVELLAG